MLHQGSAQLNKLLGFRFLGLSLPAGGFIIIVRFTRCEGQLTIGRDIDSWNRQQNDIVLHTPLLVVNYIIQALLKAHFHMKCKLFLRIGFFSAGSTPQDCCYLQLSPSSFEDGLKYRRVKLLVFDCLTKVRCCYDQKQKQRKRKLVRVLGSFISLYGDECSHVHSFVTWQPLLGVIAGGWVFWLAKEFSQSGKKQMLIGCFCVSTVQ